MSVIREQASVDENSSHGLIGRERECAALARLVAHVRDGGSQALVLSGEAGVGKTALLEYVSEHAEGCSIFGAVGVESEMELAYAGLHQLCTPMLERFDAIPTPQRDALSTALGLTAGRAPDRFLVGLAVLSLLAETARERPVICLVDDLQWLDQASIDTIAFVARRLRTEAVGIVLTERDTGADSAENLPGLARLHIGGLSDADARALLTSVVTGPLDERVRERIVAETRGNPLALLQLPSGLTPEQVAGGFGLSGIGALTSRIEQSFRRRLVPMPAATRRLLIVAAAEPGQDAVLIWRAAARLGVTMNDAAPAAADGYVSFTGQVRFCHPLARSTVYKAALPEERRAAHRALADATDPIAHPERRAWHRAHATAGLDEDVAAELERSAGLAQARGGRAAAAAFHERSAELTPDPTRRAERALVAARAKYEAGSPERALRLLAIAEAGPRDEQLAARASLVRAQVESRLTPGDGAPLLAAANRLEPLDRDLARETYRDAFYSAQIAGRLRLRGQMSDVAAATRRSASESGNIYDRLLDGLATVVAEGYPAGAPSVADALIAFRHIDLSAEEAFLWLPFASRLAHDMWDDESARILSAQMITLARERGALNTLHTALMLGVGYQVFAGDLSLATTLAEECELISEATTIPKPAYGLLVVAAWRGHEAQVVSVIADATPEATQRGEGQWLTATGWAEAVLYNGLGRYDLALAAAERGAEFVNELSIANWAMAELVEAAARNGMPERATEAVERLGVMADACGSDWVVGVAARARALVAEDDSAEPDYLKAIEHFGRTRLRSELARARLVYGEWLRRAGRRLDAREQLRQAHDVLDEIGADGFAERAYRELSATGETVRKRVPGSHLQLTQQEAQIARMAADGQTNPQIATQLYVSPRTVEWHLRKVFGKLAITSRRELAGALHDSEGAPGQPRRSR